MKKIFDSSLLISNSSVSYLRGYSHIKICKNVGYLFAPKSINDIQQIIMLAQEKKVTLKSVGGASNILFGDCERMALMVDQRMPKHITIEGNSVSLTSNLNINYVITYLSKFNLGGLEFLAGIPAHIGGILKMNTGAFGESISNFVESIKVIDQNGIIKTLKSDKIVWGNHQSNINDHILETKLNVITKPEIEIKESIKDNVDYRKKNQPLLSPNLGCFFKNPEDESAGRLIEECGLKGKEIEGSQISPKHANFFINKGKATFDSMMKLVNIAKKEVKNKFDIDLKLEIEVFHS